MTCVSLPVPLGRLWAACCLVTVLCANHAAAQDMPLTQVLLDDSPWRLVAEGFKFTEAPAVDRNGRLYFSDVPSGTVYRLNEDGKAEVFAENAGGTSGLMFGPNGVLFGCLNKAKQVVAYEPDGSFEVLADLPSANDLVVSRQGHIYVTSPKSNSVWLVKCGSTDKPQKVAEGFRPNGIILWQDEATLVVTDGNSPVLRTFRVETDGGLKFGAAYYSPLQTTFGETEPRSDGMTVDDAGRLYVATSVGVQMFDPTGRLGGSISKPQTAFLSNVVFGGPDFRTLYATSADKVFARRVKPSGTPSIADRTIGK
ncbi:MAG: SMP-30/gluconolactonase/LRE family protein [Fuerstiella sp.]